MSADLYEAFGQPPQETSINSGVNTGALPAEPNPPPEFLSHSDDTWQPWPKPTTNQIQPNNGQDTETLWESDATGADILFDAGDFDQRSGTGGNDDDDFGEFEAVDADKKQYGSTDIGVPSATTNLLDLDDIGTQPAIGSIDGGSSEQPEAPSRHTIASTLFSETGTAGYGQEVARQDEPDNEWGDFETTSPGSQTERNEASQQAEISAPKMASTRQKQGPSRQQASVSTEPILNPVESVSKSKKDLEEEQWDDFGDDSFDSSTLPITSTQEVHKQKPAKPARTTDATQRDRPTNMPPPAVLLAWVQKVFSTLASQARQSTADKMTGIAAVQAYRVCARIIAGRAMRWKRDTILAQSMRIGAAGRSGGMKLTTLDKGESRKEDQAAEEVIALWTRVSYVLSAAMTKSKVQKPPMSLSNKLNARLATGLDVMTANQACAACGLRRNERVLGIDVDVSDTFGEFWVEHWGHKDCADVWYQFNGLLDQR